MPRTSPSVIACNSAAPHHVNHYRGNFCKLALIDEITDTVTRVLLTAAASNRNERVRMREGKNCLGCSIDGVKRILKKMGFLQEICQAGRVAGGEARNGQVK